MNFQTSAAEDVSSYQYHFLPKLFSTVKMEEEMGLPLCLHCWLPGTLSWYNMWALCSLLAPLLWQGSPTWALPTNTLRALVNILNSCGLIYPSLSNRAHLERTD